VRRHYLRRLAIIVARGIRPPGELISLRILPPETFRVETSFRAPAYTGCPEKEAVKWVFVFRPQHSTTYLDAAYLLLTG